MDLYDRYPKEPNEAELKFQKETCQKEQIKSAITKHFGDMWRKGDEKKIWKKMKKEINNNNNFMYNNSNIFQISQKIFYNRS